MFDHRITTTLLLLTTLLPALQAQAEVTETLTMTNYRVGTVSRGELRSAMNAASPIRENGEIFHGYTKWHINWSFRWKTSPGGACRISSVRTDLSGNITLPSLSNADTATMTQFNQYLTALSSHEMGHFANGKETARAIDNAIASLPEMPNCQVLEASANDLAQQLIRTGNMQDKQYDATTQHGKTQGAWLAK
ncbi:DUF922 domain-containing Zn-dependent protease [Undibacterium sp. SXout7W]|uniref:DUF922 domain-containing Zn-dependent protease n=1 Tax=Undibacterium sp. SXout7W TaxID=3413049 RepID=UPI003BF0A123